MNSLTIRTAVLAGCFVIHAACFSMVLPAHAADTATPASLAAYRGRNRVLLVFAPSSRDPRYKRQEDLLGGKESGLKERDMVRFDVFEKSPSPLAKRYGVKHGDFRVILVGKDGHTAYSGARPVTPSDLFGRIDRMPMRRDEMRRRGR